jgi:aminopeptidase N
MLFDRVHTRALAADGFVTLLERHLPGERSSTLVGAVLARTLSRVLPLRVPAPDVADVVRRVAGVCAAGLGAAGSGAAGSGTAGSGAAGSGAAGSGAAGSGAAAGSPDVALAFADGYARTATEPSVLLDWLDADAVAGVPLAPRLRWRAVVRLAALGAIDADRIEAERARRPGSDAELGAAEALAARPSEEAKAAAWRTASAPDVDNRTFSAVLAGVWSGVGSGPGSGSWSAERPDPVAPYVDAYLREAPAWAARGQGFAQVVGQARPTVPLTDDQLALLHDRLSGDLPTVLRRQWSDWADDLR